MNFIWWYVLCIYTRSRSNCIQLQRLLWFIWSSLAYTIRNAECVWKKLINLNCRSSDIKGMSLLLTHCYYVCSNLNQNIVHYAFINLASISLLTLRYGLVIELNLRLLNRCRFFLLSLFKSLDRKVIRMHLDAVAYILLCVHQYLCARIIV